MVKKTNGKREIKLQALGSGTRYLMFDFWLMLYVNVFDDCFSLRSRIRQQVNCSDRAYPDLLTVVTLNVQYRLAIFLLSLSSFSRSPLFNRIEFGCEIRRYYNIVFIFVELVFDMPIALYVRHEQQKGWQCDVMHLRNGTQFH